MAVYTHLSAHEMARLIDSYDVGTLRSAKGIAEGVSNSNWLIETVDERAGDISRRFILTMYEKRTEIADLPFFLGLLDHLAAAKCPVPRTIHDKDGAAFRMVDGKAVALIEFLPGISVDRPDAAQARSVGRALAGIHLAGRDFSGARANGLGPDAWPQMVRDCGADGLASIDPALPALIDTEMDNQARRRPAADTPDLPRGVIHADLFPDNVLMVGDQVSGLIDFYFACTDFFALDLATTHAAWCFGPDGRAFDANLSRALIEGYEDVRKLSDAERAALPVLARGTCLRFVLTRADDWLNTPGDALVAKKDPMDFARRMQFYAAHGKDAFER
jgi:homoserine kinase type II